MTIHVHFVLLDGCLVLDWAGPAEVLRLANLAMRERGLPDAFAWDFVGPSAECHTSIGATVSHIAPLPKLTPSADRTDWVVLLGQVGTRMNLETPAAQAVLRWLSTLTLREGQTELVCVCAGAIIAARAGLLSGRDATTHHEHLEELRETEPRCRVAVNRVFTSDGPVWSSAGVTTGIDLMLHRVSMVCGPTVAAQVAQALVVAMRRGPNDPEMSPFLAHRNHLHAALHRVQDAVCRDPQASWPLAHMAALAHTSPRHLGRLFSDHTGTTPLNYLRQIRLAVAEAALNAGHNVTQAAALAGFGSDTQLRRTWQQLGKSGTPSAAGR
ncbi:GlxA family transcriptional regulator [Hydrogenophaga atypica]|uniref:GlxA family transcriptional regulator n=1 Tax=Hydrogenophaga atypica TaxID=249409 RepID=A0ABW2QPK9_9BURK